jgi:hypothetical protein
VLELAADLEFPSCRFGIKCSWSAVREIPLLTLPSPPLNSVPLTLAVMPTASPSFRYSRAASASLAKQFTEKKRALLLTGFVVLRAPPAFYFDKELDPRPAVFGL